MNQKEQQALEARKLLGLPNPHGNGFMQHVVEQHYCKQVVEERDRMRKALQAIINMAHDDEMNGGYLGKLHCAVYAAKRALEEDA